MAIAFSLSNGSNPEAGDLSPVPSCGCWQDLKHIPCGFPDQIRLSGQFPLLYVWLGVGDGPVQMALGDLFWGRKL